MGTKNVLIADKLHESVLSRLTDLGLTVDYRPGLAGEQLREAVAATADILVVRSTRVPAELLVTAGRLELVVRAGAGVNTIDVAAASARGIHVANCPGTNAAAVAELTIGLLICADRRIPDAVYDLRAGLWKKAVYGNAGGLRGRCLGLIGYGSIGRAVAQRARALEMDVCAWSRSLNAATAQRDGVTACESPADVAMRADAVSVHLAYTPETHHCIDQRFFENFPSGGIFINTSRGEIVDQAALAAAVAQRGVRAALDVFEGEPAGGSGTFEQTDLAAVIYGTPHIGASTTEAEAATAAEVVHVIRQFVSTGVPANSVNLQNQTQAPFRLVVRHLNKVGVLASVLDVLRTAGINIEDMNNQIFAGGAAACCTLRMDREPPSAAVEKIRSVEHVLQLG